MRICLLPTPWQRQMQWYNKAAVDRELTSSTAEARSLCAVHPPTHRQCCWHSTTEGGHVPLLMKSTKIEVCEVIDSTGCISGLHMVRHGFLWKLTL